MIEQDQPAYDFEIADLHARAMEYADKASGRLEPEPGERLDPMHFYRVASGFEQGVFWLIPNNKIEMRGQAAANAVGLLLNGRDFVGAVTFGRDAMEDMGDEMPGIPRRRIEDMIDRAVEAIFYSPKA